MSDDLEHGTHDPHQGWYDSARRAWVDRPDKLTPIRPRPAPRARRLDDHEFRTSPVSTAERRQAGNAAAFRPNGQMEQLRRLRASDRPADRDRYERIVKGTTRMSLGSYERALRDYLDAGNQLPDGVAPLDG